MTAAELLEALEKAGGRLEVVEGAPRLKGQKIPDELKLAIKDNRAAVLEEYERRRLADRDRYCRVPAPDAGMVAPQDMPGGWKKPVCDYVMRQPRPVHAWVMARARDYFLQGVPQDECEWKGCVDVVAWQRQTDGHSAAEWVVDLNEVAGTMAKGK